MKNGGLVAHPARSDDAAGPDHMEQALDNGHLWDIVSGLGMFLYHDALRPGHLS